MVSKKGGPAAFGPTFLEAAEGRLHYGWWWVGQHNSICKNNPKYVRFCVPPLGLINPPGQYWLGGGLLIRSRGGLLIQGPGYIAATGLAPVVAFVVFILLGASKDSSNLKLFSNVS